MFEILVDPSLFIVDKNGYPMTNCDAELYLFRMLNEYVCHHKLSHYWPEVLESLQLGLMSQEQLAEVWSTVNELRNSEVKDKCSESLVRAEKLKNGENMENRILLNPRKNLDRPCYSKSEVFSSGNDHFNQNEIKPFNDLMTQNGYTSELMFIVGMKVLVGKGWMKDVDVVVGLEIEYNNGKTIFHGNKNSEWKISYFKVGFGEKITKVVIKFGWAMNSLEFHSNKGHKWGPFGGEEGQEIVLEPENSKGFLATIAASTVKNKDHDLIRYVYFV